VPRAGAWSLENTSWSLERMLEYVDTVAGTTFISLQTLLFPLHRCDTHVAIASTSTSQPQILHILSPGVSEP
jgi:hypothetical protein